MNHTYGLNDIWIEVRRKGDSEEWICDIRISSIADPTTIYRILPVRPFLGTEAKAKAYGLRAAKKWIDEGKPDLLPERWFEDQILH